MPKLTLFPSKRGNFLKFRLCYDKEKGDGKKMINVLKKITAVLAAGIILGSSGCGAAREALPEDTIEEYEEAYNAMDVQAMMDCLDESTKKSLTAGMDSILGIVKAASGIDLGISGSDLMDMASLLQAFTGELMAEAGGAAQIDLKVEKTCIKGKRATAYCTEQNTSMPMNINMVKDDGKWYITLSTITISEENAERVILAEDKKAAKSSKTKEEKDRSPDKEKLKEYLLEKLK